jgi:hypothetical protein
MDTLTLTRRKSQLELLALACESRYSARVALAERSRGTTHIPTRFLALEPGGVLLEWPPQAIGAHVVSGAAVTVFFDHQDQCLSFRADTRGRAWWCSSSRGQVAAWKLGLPLRIDSRQQRESRRISLTDIGPVPARCTSVTDPQRCFTVRLRNLSIGGLSATAALTRVAPLHAGTMFWTQFELPGEPGGFEFVVRVAHVHSNKPTDTLVLGCAFCPGEDPLPYRTQLARIGDFVARRQQARDSSVNRAKPEEHD